MGSGTVGEVRRCKHMRTKVERAVKILKKDQMDEFESQIFKHEMELLKMLDHPNIQKLHEVYEDDKRYYLVIELCTGGELFD